MCSILVRQLLSTDVKHVFKFRTLHGYLARVEFSSPTSQCLTVRELHGTRSLETSKWCVGDPNGNPINELQQYATKPIIDEKDIVFQPTPSEIDKAQVFFKPEGQKLKSLKGVVDLKDLPPAKLPEVCFIGRSNVGKSSLIKSLFFDPPDVKISISSKPGHTRALKFYSIPRTFSLVDMPGYGYNMPEYFVESVEEYIKNRTTLQRIFLLIDGSVGVTGSDKIGLNMLEEFGKSYTVVLTKIDKASHHKVLTNLIQFNTMRKDHLMCCLPQSFLVSAHLGAGVPLLRAFIAYVTGNLVS